MKRLIYKLYNFETSHVCFGLLYTRHNLTKTKCEVFKKLFNFNIRIINITLRELEHITSVYISNYVMLAKTGKPCTERLLPTPLSLLSHSMLYHSMLSYSLQVIMDPSEKSRRFPSASLTFTLLPPPDFVLSLKSNLPLLLSLILAAPLH